MILPFPPWRPDTTDIGDDGTVALGVVPVIQERGGISYGPFPSFGVLIDTALAGMCQGAAAFLDANGDTHIFAGSAEKIEKLNGATWDDVSDAGGYSIGTDSLWKFLGMRIEDEDLIFALGDINTDIQVYDITSSTDFGQLSADAPRAKCGAIMDGNVLMVGNTWDSVGGYAQSRVWWHGKNALTGVPLPDSWPTPGGSTAQEQQSDYRDLETNGPIVAMTGPIGGSVAGLVFAGKSIHRVLKDPGIGYSFYKLTSDIGCAAPNGVINVRSRVFFPSDDGFYATDGNGVVPIGSQKVDRWFYSVVNEGALGKMFGVASPRSKLAIWAFASGSSSVADYALALNYEFMEFSLIANDLALEFLFQPYSVGYTEEGLAALYTYWEDVPGSADSPAFQGGRPYIGGFNSDHKFGSFQGANLAARIETGEPDLDNRSYRTTGIAPMIQADGTLAAGDVTSCVGWRRQPNGTVTYDTATNIADNGICPQLRSAKFQRARVNIAAGVDWKLAAGAKYYSVKEGTL